MPLFIADTARKLGGQWLSMRMASGCYVTSWISVHITACQYIEGNGSTLNDSRWFDSSDGTFEVGLIVTATTVNGDDDPLKVTVFAVGPAAR